MNDLTRDELIELSKRYYDYERQFSELSDTKTKLLVTKNALDDDIREVNRKIKSLDFKFHILQKELSEKVQSGGE